VVLAMINSKKEANYYDKVNYILQALANQVSRDKIALELGYTNPKSLDIYMRRKGFLYERGMRNYIPIKTSNITESQTFNSDKRLTTILTLFSQENADPRKIAELTGFESHIELAEYMKANKFSCNDSFGNYSKEIDPISNQMYETSDFAHDSNEFLHYLPLLRKLLENKDKLFNLLESQINSLALIELKNEDNMQPIQITINGELQSTINAYLKQNTITMNEFIELAIMNFLKL
jgi:hypothetical protein